MADSSKLLGTLATKDQQIGSLVDNLSTVTSAVSDLRVQLQTAGELATLADTLAGTQGSSTRVLVTSTRATGRLAQLVKTNHTSLARDLDSLVTVLELVRKHQARSRADPRPPRRRAARR